MQFNKSKKNKKKIISEKKKLKIAKNHITKKKKKKSPFKYLNLNERFLLLLLLPKTKQPHVLK